MLGWTLKKNSSSVWTVDLSAQPAQLGISHSNFLKGWNFFKKRLTDNASPAFYSLLEYWGFGFFQFKTHFQPRTPRKHRKYLGKHIHDHQKPKKHLKKTKSIQS